MNPVALNYNDQTLNTGLVQDYDLQNPPGHDDSMHKLIKRAGSFGGEKLIMFFKMQMQLLKNGAFSTSKIKQYDQFSYSAKTALLSDQLVEIALLPNSKLLKIFHILTQYDRVFGSGYTVQAVVLK